jgi:ubiquinone/menaquinone biosynthesis C-methylase UbiE
MTKIRRILKLYLNDKQYAEYEFWRKEVKKRILWYKGETEYLLGHHCPNESFKVKNYSLRENAIRTFIKANFDKYPKKLSLSVNHFEGKTILDIGCGPNPWATAFIGCRVYGLDQLINEYRKLGFPMERFCDRLRYLKGSVENIPVTDNFFDAVIAVNSIDHIDDFSKAAKEIRRVLKPDGELRMEVHYHKPTICEPWELDDALIENEFGCLGIEKQSEYRFQGRTGEEIITIWGNKL